MVGVGDREGRIVIGWGGGGVRLVIGSGWGVNSGRVGGGGVRRVVMCLVTKYNIVER